MSCYAACKSFISKYPNSVLMLIGSSEKNEKLMRNYINGLLMKIK